MKARDTNEQANIFQENLTTVCQQVSFVNSVTRIFCNKRNRRNIQTQKPQN